MLDEVEKINSKKYVKKIDKSEVIVGPQNQCLNQKKIL